MNHSAHIFLLLLLALLFQASAGPYEKAEIRVRNDLIAADPNNAFLYLDRGEFFRADTEYRLALIDFDRVEELAPDMPTLDLARARVFDDMNRPEEGLEALVRFLQLSPDDVEGLELKAEFLLQLERFEEADEIYRGLIESAAFPRVELILKRSQNLQESGDAEGALSVVADGIERLNGSRMLEAQALVLEIEMGSYDIALERVDQWIESEDRHRARYYKQRADILVLLEDFGLAYFYFVKALNTFDADYPDAEEWPALKRYREDLVALIETYRESAVDLGDKGAVVK